MASNLILMEPLEGPPALHHGTWLPGEVREELDRILRSALFVRSVRLSQFLRLTVEYVLEGRPEMVKEYTIGVEVYGRQPSYDPCLDSIVRSEARRLRFKLKQYYETEGRRSQIVIHYESGSYRPQILRSPTSARPASLRPISLRLPNMVDERLVAVYPFTCSPAASQASEVAYGLREEIVHTLALTPGIQVLYCGDRHEAESLDELKHMGVQSFLHGTVQLSDQLLTVTVRSCAASSLVQWSQRFEIPLPTDLFARQGEVAKAASERLAVQFPH